MAEIKVIHGSCFDVAPQSADLICTDPPFDMAACDVVRAVSRNDSSHLVMITTMRQLIGFVRASDEWVFSFDFVLDLVGPKQSKSVRQPNYRHTTGVYFTRGNAKSAFDRKARQREDVASSSGYWPTIIRAPSGGSSGGAYEKSESAIIDILGSFPAISTVLDPFAGTGTVAMAAFELGISATMIEQDPSQLAAMRNRLKFVGATFV